MNRIYRLAWNRSLGCFVPASEVTRARGKGKSGRSNRTIYGAKRGAAAALAAAAAVSMGPLSARAGPTGGQIIAGSGNIAQSGNTTTISQDSQTLSVNWATFNIAPQETVSFLQPSAAAIAINRIFDVNGTQILGHLNANGQIFLINPNGVLFGRGAEVDVGGLVASTLDLSDSAAAGNSKTFSGTGSGSVINQGSLTAADGGYVALLGNHVGNQGVITARLGTVALGAGSAATLTFNGNELVSLQVSQSVLNSEADNGGLIQADGGRVIMTAGAKDALLASVVNNTGVIEARTVDDQGGVITLLGGMADGTVNVGGTLDASAPNGGNGGSIETSAAHVEVAEDARVTTASAAGLYGSWLVDPTDFTIAATGGDTTGTALGNELATTSVVIQSSGGATAGSGNVNVNAAVTWAANTTLTLTAANNINVNANITASGNTAALSLNPNTANGGAAATGTGTLMVAAGESISLNGTTPALAIAGTSYTLGAGATINLPGTGPNLTIGGQTYTVINSLGAPGSTTGTDLQGINGNAAGHYALGSNINASATSTWNAGAGFTPLAGTYPTFSGVFDGLGHTITGLVINLPTTDYVGMFNEVAAGGIVRNFTLSGGSVTAVGDLGAVVGINYGQVLNVQSSANVTGETGGYNVGGLVGLSSAGSSITNSSSSGTVVGFAPHVGGLTGANYGPITNSFATGNVSGPSYVGGLSGKSTASISNSYASGTVTSAGATVGGLVGGSYGGLTNDYATGAVTAGNDTGGLVGVSGTGAYVSNSYATGNVSGASYSGGLVGYNVNGSTITSSYATGTVSGTNAVGGLVGENNTNGAMSASSIGFSYATGAVSGTTVDIAGLVGANTGQILDSYATGNTTSTGTAYVGGLVGYNSNTAIIADSYATAAVAGGSSNDVGGLIGANYGSIVDSYSAGHVTSTGTSVGGLAGANSSAILRSFWDTTTSGQSTSAAGVGMTTAQMMTQTNFTSATAANGNSNPSWTFNSNWFMYSGYTYPLLQNFLTPLTVTVNNATKVYDGNAYSGGNGLSYSVTPNLSDLFNTSSYGGTAQGAITVAGSPYTLTSNAYSNQQGYLITFVNGTLTVTPAPLTVTGETASNKVYNGNYTATLMNGTLSGVVAGDVGNVTLSQSGTFSSKNVANGIPVTATDTISGSAAGNYSLTQPTGLTANITAAPLTVTGEMADNKVYNDTYTAILSGGTLNGLVSGDAGTVTLNQTGTFASKNVANNIVVTATDTLSGTNALNYSLTQPTGLSANITAAPVTVAGETANNKVFDNTFTATLTGGTLVGAVAGDSVSLVQAGTFASKNVGTGIAVTAADTLTGASAIDYSLTQPTGLSANITPAPLTVTGETAANKAYDGTTAATLTGGTLVGIVTGDGSALTLTDSGHFASKNAGTGVAVTATDTFSGTGAGNYTLVQPTGITANITPLAVTVSGETADNKVYDGTVAATLTGGTLTGVLAGDTVTLTDAGSFTSKNVGQGIAVTVADTLGGSGAGNYTLTEPSGLTANISAATLTYLATPITLGAGIAPVGLTGMVNGFVSGDTLANSTTGTLTWITPATATTPPGSYAIDGTGLSATNYVFVQAAGNATALTLKALSGPPAAQNAVAQTESLLPSPQANIATTVLDLPPAIAMADASAGGGAYNVAGATSGAGADASLFHYEGIVMDSPTAPRINFPAVHIVDGGVKVPDNTVTVNE